MKTEALLTIKSNDELSAVLGNMDTAEREKHARNLATKLRLDYQDSFSQVVSIATQCGDMDDITTRLTNHFLEKTNQAFKVDDDALLLKYTSSPVETEIEEEFDLSALSTADKKELEEKECELAYTQHKLAESRLKLGESNLALLRSKRTLATSVFGILVLMVLIARANAIVTESSNNQELSAHEEPLAHQEPSTSDA